MKRKAHHEASSPAKSQALARRVANFGAVARSLARRIYAAPPQEALSAASEAVKALVALALASRMPPGDLAKLFREIACEVDAQAVEFGAQVRAALRETTARRGSPD